MVTRVSPRTLSGARRLVAASPVPSNVTPGQGIVVDKAEELATYDALPTRWRRLVDGLPIPQRVAAVREYLDKLGDDVGYARVVEVFRQRYPGWQPPAAIEVSAASQITPRAPRRRRRGMIVVSSD